MSQPAQLYVIEHYIHCGPNLKVWDLIEERKECWIVDLRGNRKVFKKGTQGRHYFTDKAKVVAYLRKNAQQVLKEAKRTAIRMQTLLMRSDDDIFDFARGFDRVVMEVELLTNDREKLNT